MQQLTFPYIIQIVPLEMIKQYDGIVMVFLSHFQKGTNTSLYNPILRLQMR